MRNEIEKGLKNIICFSHLRWDFVYQRPQHLLSRFASNFQVYFFEEPIFDADQYSYLSINKKQDNLKVIIPHLEPGKTPLQNDAALRSLLTQFLAHKDLQECIFWYYTPMALNFTNHLKPGFIIYDCMDELSAFKFAPQEMIGMEKKLMSVADIIFTGGNSLYEAKKKQHANIFPFPSSIDKLHFTKARKNLPEPADQARIHGPKIGFCGVIDERFDMGLIASLADQRQDWQFVLIGPVVKIDEHSLPKHSNIHYLGQKSYNELPAYLSHWEVAMIPFLLNESTAFISPTKTPEYLAAGIPVVSSLIKDVINPYGILNLVQMCDSESDFLQAIEKELNSRSKKTWLKEVDLFLKDISWDHTYREMNLRIQQTINRNKISIAS